MMVNLFTLIWYAGGMEATRSITPGLEPKDTAGWNKLDIERCVSQPAVYLFFMILGQSGIYIQLAFHSRSFQFNRFLHPFGELLNGCNT